MAISLKGDQKISTIPATKSKALRINLNTDIYGTFAEIGAGQETVRNFFRAGASSGTIAKAMSAYDKDFSDAIYGIEEDKRYVTEPRLKRMLRHEIDLIEDRLSRSKHPDKLFFSYANTVATIDFAKKFKGHGWVGIRFQLDPLEDYNEIILHLRFKETDARLQQETLGILGVNLIHGAFYLNDNPKELVKSFYDNLDGDQLEIDMINFSGPRFMYVDNRLMSLQLLKNGMTNAVMFGPDGINLLPAQVLYKKNILALRGSFRPVTKVNMDMYEKSKKLFLAEKKVKEENTQVIFEITLSNLRAEGEINERDFLDRAELLCSLGQNVMITNFQQYFKLVEYFSEFTKERMGLSMGVHNLIQIFDENGKFENQWVNMSKAAALCIFTENQTELMLVGEYFAGIKPNSMGTNLGPRLSVLDLAGNVLARIGKNSYGSESGRFFSPHGITMDSKGDIYVAEVSWSDYGSQMNPPRELRSLQKLERIIS